MSGPFPRFWRVLQDLSRREAYLVVTGYAGLAFVLVRIERARRCSTPITPSPNG